MKKYLLGVFLAALAMYVWGTVYWLSPIPYLAVNTTPDDASAGRALLEYFPESGTYTVPGPAVEPEQAVELSIEGPVAFVHLAREGRDPFSPTPFIIGFVQHILFAILISGLLFIGGSSMARYQDRVKLIAVAGFISAFFVRTSNTIWQGLPVEWELVNGIYEIVAWLLAGTVLAAFYQPKTAR
ncbi:MAG: hypothetical protein MJA83_15055 [Gammaproteobacteria bacterium]|nr:hypothetical protein [Gammaproteobacteria bacterium]